MPLLLVKANLKTQNVYKNKSWALNTLLSGPTMLAQVQLPMLKQKLKKKCVYMCVAVHHFSHACNSMFIACIRQPMTHGSAKTHDLHSMAHASR